jgi:hypothetical protein
VAVVFLSVRLFSEESFLKLPVLEDFTGFEMGNPFFVNFDDTDCLPDFVPGLVFSERVRESDLSLPDLVFSERVRESDLSLLPDLVFS